eukprot:UC4_evm3s59
MDLFKNLLLLLPITCAHGMNFAFEENPFPALIDPFRKNWPTPRPLGLLPMQWGAVRPKGFLLEWASQAAQGAASPSAAAFTTLTFKGKHSADGWRHGRPNFGGFWDEDSAYWIDGVTRLGFVLRRNDLLKRASEDVEYVIANPYNFHNTFPGDVVEGWVRSVYSRAMIAYLSGTGDEKVIKFFVDVFSNYTAADSSNKNQDESHQGSRSMTQMEAMLEVYSFGGPAWMVNKALSLMGPHANNGGYSFLQELLSGCLMNRSAILRGACEQQAHGVTFNEVSKLFAMASSFSGNISHAVASVRAYEILESYDMQPHGVNSAAEDLNGIGPGIATETCDVSDFIYSNAWLLRVTGDGRYGDHMERAIYNAAPAAVNRTFKGHARMLPNFIHHIFMATKNKGIAVAAYGPAVVSFSLGNVNVSIESMTEYPFNDFFNFTFEVKGGIASFPFLLRVPSWANESYMSIKVNDASVALRRDTTLKSFISIERDWHDGDILTMVIRSNLIAKKGVTVNSGWTTRLQGGHMNNTNGLEFCTVQKGPLLFALPLENSMEFNYGIHCSNSSLNIMQAQGLKSPFDWPLNAPLQVTAQAEKVLWDNVWNLPQNVSRAGDWVNITLVPYGCTQMYRTPMDRAAILALREKTREAFLFAHDAYLNHAFPLDELDPVGCRGRGPDYHNPLNININDALGNYSLTLVDSLDSLAIMGERNRFWSALRLVNSTISFDQNTNVQVFEVNIRVLGALLSSHIFASDPVFGMLDPAPEPPYQGELLRLAKDLGDRLLPAFTETATGIPHPRVNLRHGLVSRRAGLPPTAYNQTCTAGAGTLLLEFGLLSSLTGDPIYARLSRKALFELWRRRSNVTGLLGSTLDIQTGIWINKFSGLGAGIDSFYEYLLKAYALFGNEEYLVMFDESYSSIHNHLLFPGHGYTKSSGKNRETKSSPFYGIPIYTNVHMENGNTATNWIDSLAAYFPGIQVMHGDLELAALHHAVYHALWRRYKSIPERFNWLLKVPDVAVYPLRPEFVESTYILYRATRDRHYLRVGKEILEALLSTPRTSCGFATLHDVRDGSIEDRMESFFLSETLKYLYLLFDEANVLHSDIGPYVFNTQAHLLKLSQNMSIPLRSSSNNLPSSATSRSKIMHNMNSIMEATDESEKRLKKIGTMGHPRKSCPAISPRMIYMGFVDSKIRKNIEIAVAMDQNPKIGLNEIGAKKSKSQKSSNNPKTFQFVIDTDIKTWTGKDILSEIKKFFRPATPIGTGEKIMENKGKDNECYDSTSWITQVGKRSCEWIAKSPKIRCSFKDISGISARDACRLTCGKCRTLPKNHEKKDEVLVQKSQEQQFTKSINSGVGSSIASKTTESEKNIASNTFRGSFSDIELKQFFQGKTCFTANDEGFWNFEICLGKKITQIHRNKGEGIKVLLGNFYTNGTSRVAIDNDNHVRSIESTYIDGDFCREINANRHADVVISCNELLGNAYSNKGKTSLDGRILETSICAYRIELDSPAACRYVAPLTRKI